MPGWTTAPRFPEVKAAGRFQEDQHPRANDGKFSHTAGTPHGKFTLGHVAAKLPPKAPAPPPKPRRDRSNRGLAPGHKPPPASAATPAVQPSATPKPAGPSINYTRERPKGKPADEPVGSGSKHGPPVLSPEAYEGLKPATKQSFSLRDRSLETLGDSDDARVLADTLARWQDGGGVKRLRTKIDVMTNGGEVDAKTRQRAETLLNAIEHSPPEMAPPTLYRGMAVSGSAQKILDSYKTGSTINMLPSSFTSDRNVAHEFGQPVGNRRTQVRIEMTGEKHALPIQNLSKSNNFFREKEWVTAGSFEVVSAKKSADGQVVIKIKQVSVL